jgi:hypothetical protein
MEFENCDDDDDDDTAAAAAAAADDRTPHSVYVAIG